MNEKVNLKEKLAYGVGDAGCNFVCKNYRQNIN